MVLVPSRGKTGEPGSPDAKFRIMRSYKKNQRSAQSRRTRISKRHLHRIQSRANSKFQRTLFPDLPIAEIKFKFKELRCVRKSSDFKRKIPR